MFASRLSLVELREARSWRGLLAEAAHDADAREGLLQVAGDRADRLARAPEGAGRDEPEPDASRRPRSGSTQNVISASFTSRKSRITSVPISVRPRLEQRHDASR